MNQENLSVLRSSFEERRVSVGYTKQGGEMKKAQWLGLVVAGLLAVGASAYVFTGQQEIGTAKASVRASVRDPDAVKFSAVRFNRSTGAVCGTFNAKNGFGAYVGMQAFAVSSGGQLHLQPGRPSSAPDTSDTTGLSPVERERLIAKLDQVIAETSAYKNALETFHDLCVGGVSGEQLAGPTR